MFRAATSSLRYITKTTPANSLSLRTFASTARMPGPAVSRCSHVGSWLRPQSVKDARAAFAKGEINEQKLRELTDPAIAEVVEQQRKAGLKEISDVSPGFSSEMLCSFLLASFLTQYAAS